MTFDEIYNNILVPSITARFTIDKSKIKPEASFKKDLELDSLDMVDLICEIEDKYGKELIDDSDEKTVEEFQRTSTGTLADMTNLLLTKINKEVKNE